MQNKSTKEITDEDVFLFAQKIFNAKGIQLVWDKETEQITARKGGNETKFGFDLLRV